MPKELRMIAYYYSFEPTGVEAIDRILSAIAEAGAGAHNTADWNDAVREVEPFRGATYVEFIQNAANDAADLLRARSAPAPQEG